jgi:organic hydroperoxide reductase OsmC/OhrA
MDRQHNYNVHIVWKSKNGTVDYKSYQRDHTISITNKPIIEASSDPSFRGNPVKYNPEELFVASIANCHMLWYLHLCAINNIVVIKYEDSVRGIMAEQADGNGRFTEVVLYPIVTVLSKEMINKAESLHKEANKFCFIANSLNFAVTHQPKTIVKENNV